LSMRAIDRPYRQAKNLGAAKQIENPLSSEGFLFMK